MKKYLLTLIIFSLLFISCSKKENKDYEEPVTRKFNSFIFVGMIDNIPGLYKYSLNDSSYTKYWSSKNEEVVELSYADNHASAFFVTAAKTGKEGIFPFIKEAKLYVIPDTSSQPQFVRIIGSGIQVFSRWESEIVFRIVLNSWDKKVSTFINQTTSIFNIYGRVLQEETQSYDITKDGYPRLPQIQPDFNSPSGIYTVSINQTKPDSVVLIRNSDKSEFFITMINQPVNDISWSDSRKFLIISTLDLTPANRSIYSEKPNTSSIYVYSINQKKIVKEWNGSVVKNFFTINDFLIFDDGFGRNSSIYIYNLITDSIVDQVKIKDGCGLREIPKIPRFGA